MAKEELEQNQQEQAMSPTMKAVLTGFIGGLLWSLLGYVAYIFHFTKLGPALVLGPWELGEWKEGVLGQFVGIFVIACLSIPVALLYKGVLAKVDSMWPGIIVGGALWALVFFVLNPLFPDLKSVKEIGINTNITTICLYILYGVFIGYSISFDYKEMNRLKSAQTYSK